MKVLRLYIEITFPRPRIRPLVKTAAEHISISCQDLSILQSFAKLAADDHGEYRVSDIRYLDVETRQGCCQVVAMQLSRITTLSMWNNPRLFSRSKITAKIHSTRSTWRMLPLDFFGLDRPHGTSY